MSLADSIEGLLIDIDGVLVVSWEPIAGARDALAALRSSGRRFLLATNTTTAGRSTLVRRLCEAGFDVELEDLVTAPLATAAYLRARHPGASCFLLATGDVAEDFADVELVDADADVVVIAGAEERFTYDNMNRAYRMLNDGAALVAMHRNVSWMTSEGLKLDAGPYVRALEEAAEVEAVVVGKPSADFFATAVALLGGPRERVAMVGDDIHSDVLAAQALGLTGVLVRTGKFRPEVLERAGGAPDHVIDSIADLPALLSEEQQP
ncbi:MAG: TIGR01458 family HAD-type hydrolase [Actinomycetota bacterium]